MKPIKCIACGSEDLYHAQKLNVVGHIRPAWTVIRLAFMQWATVQCSVCLSCGCVAPYLDDGVLKAFRTAKRKQNAPTAAELARSPS